MANVIHPSIHPIQSKPFNSSGRVTSGIRKLKNTHSLVITCSRAPVLSFSIVLRTPYVQYNGRTVLYVHRRPDTNNQIKLN